MTKPRLPRGPRALAGDEDAFAALTNPYRHELRLHCYRIVGSAQDAEDLLQETLLAAWRGLAQSEGRASVRAWLYRIATNRCLDALRASGRCPPRTAAMVEPSEPTRLNEPICGRERAATQLGARTCARWTVRRHCPGR